MNGPSAPALDQLREATVQTQGLQVADRVLSGYGYGFCACVAAAERPQHWGKALHDLEHGEVFVLGVDPEEHVAPLPRGEGAILRRAGGAWAVRDRDRFARSAFDAARAQLLLWAGDEDLAREVLRAPPPERRGPTDARSSTRSDALGDFEGVELRIGAPGNGPGLRIFDLRADGFEPTDGDRDDLAVSIDEDGSRLEVELVDGAQR